MDCSSAGSSSEDSIAISSSISAVVISSIAEDSCEGSSAIKSVSGNSPA